MFKTEKELPKNTQNKYRNKRERNYRANEKFVDDATSVIISKDSMIKHLNGWEMSNNPGCKICVKCERLYTAIIKGTLMQT